MATQFHPSVLASDVFGSAGDVTAVHRDGKVYLRKRKVGAGTLSPAQLEHLEVHRRALAAWRRLDHETQLVWNEYAREVEPHRPPFDHSSWISGQNLFVSAYHGFHTLGNEHVPSPAPFESFPSFVVEAMSATSVGNDLLLRVERGRAVGCPGSRCCLQVLVSLCRWNWSFLIGGLCGRSWWRKGVIRCMARLCCWMR